MQVNTSYQPAEIEKKWQQRWAETKIYKNYQREKKFYALDMFPYPSGAGLHVGHPKGYIATDIVARFKILNGYSVIHPMGWDAFGLPAENYAIQNKVHPRVAVEKNIATFKKQLELFGFTYDWDREINTTDPDYYKWTQWIFLKLFEKGLAYESDEPVNWCPSCQTVLANEDLEAGLCERCGTQVIQKKMRQWVLKMTAYADRLLDDLDSEDLDWEEPIKEQQRNWIGRSEGAQFTLKLSEGEGEIAVYTTRLDTVFGMTYVVVAPEHEIVKNLKSKVKNYDEVEQYLIKAQNKTELERIEMKEKSGVELEGIKVINPFTNETVPVFIADYVLSHYGTGAVIAVPAHDQRDFEFAQKYNLPIKIVICPNYPAAVCPILDEAFVGDGYLVASGDYTGLTSLEAREKMVAWLEDKQMGRRQINYKMRDWVFSRQRYWGEPIPIVHCEKCASTGSARSGTVAVPEEQLPIKLPDVTNYEPTGTGESPLANIAEWVNTTCPTCHGPARRETNTMPQWAGSSWYYLRYIDPRNKEELIDPQKEKVWMPVNLYVGGAEHATRHLLYARFWHKFLYDIGVVSTKEPFKRLVHVGLIKGEDGRKMSKRWGNVINPDDIIQQFGADSLRLYEMFMGPFTQNISWSTAGVSGVRRFLDKVWRLAGKVDVGAADDPIIAGLLHRTIKKVGEDIKGFKFNTAVSAMMVLVNRLETVEKISPAVLEKLLIILSPFAPHIAEELWFGLGHQESIFSGSWVAYDQKLLKEDVVELVVQVNGRVRDRLIVPTDSSEGEVNALALQSEKIKSTIHNQPIKKIIFVANKLINLVIN